MTQTVKTMFLTPGESVVVFNSADTSRRCFLGIYALDLTPSVMRYLNISFGDINFTYHFTLSPYCKYFECRGKNIFQGNILVRNTSIDTNHLISATEILK